MAYKILIVEDEAPMVRILADRFTREGFEVQTAKNGEEGLAAALKGHPDVILLDIIMPIMDGMTMLEELRQDEWGARVPVFLLTNLSEPEKIAQAQENRVKGYLVKANWKLEDIVAKVKDTFSAPTSQSGSSA